MPKSEKIFFLNDPSSYIQHNSRQNLPAVLRPCSVPLRRFQPVQRDFLLPKENLRLCPFLKEIYILQLILLLKPDTAHADGGFLLHRNFFSREAEEISVICLEHDVLAVINHLHSDQRVLFLKLCGRDSPF